MFDTIKDFAQYVEAKVREKGLFHCLKVGCIVVIRKLTFYPIGLILFPLCWVFKIRFLNVLTPRIGHLCAEPDCYIKEEILGKHARYKAIILASTDTVANKHLLSYWDKYFKIIKSPVACMLLRPLSENPFTVFDVYRYCGYINKTVDYPWIQAEYHKSGGRPLLTLTKSDYDRGWDLLRKIGVPRGAWFVCIHCREEGYKSGEGQTYRNTDIDNYVLAMEAIVDRGGWVIRLGDSSMKALAFPKNSIDYAHLDIKSDWMDIFLSASCTLFLGGCSGLAIVPNIFGVPVGALNNAPMSTVLSYAPYNVGIPMLMRRKTEKRYLSFKEVFDSPMANFRFDYLYSNAGLETVQNSSEDIRDVAIEILDRLEGKLRYSDEDERLQALFKSFLKPTHYSYGAASRVGRDFLRKYEYLL